MVHLESDIASAHAHDFVTDLDELHQQLWKHILKLIVNTKPLLISDDFWPWNSILEATYTSRLNSSVQHDPPRNSLINSLDHMKYLHSLAPITSPYDFQKVFMLYTQFFMSPCWNQQLWIWSLMSFNPTPTNHCQWWTRILNLRNPQLQDWQLSLHLKTIVSCLLDRVWGHWQRNFLDPHFWAQTWFQTCCRFPLCISSQVWSSFKSMNLAHFIFELLLKFHTFYKSKQFLLQLPYSGVFYQSLYLLQTRPLSRSLDILWR